MVSVNQTDESIRIIVKAERQVAYLSPDHLVPWGTRRDNSRNKRFNEKLYKLYPQFQEKPIKILDMGCSGGGFVKDCIDDGCLAVGLEGSDFSKKYRRAEWGTIPDFLFTCDITGDFEILLKTNQGEEIIQFEAITTWEVIEHIAEKDLAKVSSNVKKHLTTGGLWILSVSPNEEVIDGIRLHQTVHDKPWWIAKFKELGFEHLEEYVNYFNTQFIRGPKYGAPDTFHLILSVDKSKVPSIPKQSISHTIYDWWLGSRPQKIVRRLLIGE